MSNDKTMKYTILKEIGETDALIVPVFKTKDIVSQVDISLKQALKDVVDMNDFEANTKQMLMLYGVHIHAKRVVFVGLGDEKEFSVRMYKEAVAIAISHAQTKKAEHVTMILPKKLLDKDDSGFVSRETIIAMRMSTYAYDNFKSDKESHTTIIKEIAVLPECPVSTYKKIQNAMEEASIIADTINSVRDIGNTPPSVMTPTLLAQYAQDLARDQKKLQVKILSKIDMEKLGMGCLLGVGQGSEHEPKFIILEYWGTSKQKKPSVLVGKGITFDSGGLSLKPGDSMVDMKYDMLGGASVIASIKILADLGVKKNIVALVSSAENMPSGHAYRPDDILTAMNGKTIEVKNTDAEGRLVLADALCYAHRYHPKEVIDMATLTGACLSALGTERVGIFSNENNMVEGLKQASERVGEYVWQLPLGDEHREAMKSDIADIKNIGGVNNPRYATASTAAAFLEFFTRDADGKYAYPWLHMDIACAIDHFKGKSWLKPGATGQAIQTVVEYLR